MINKLRKLYYKRGTKRYNRAYLAAICDGNKKRMEFFSKECK